MYFLGLLFIISYVEILGLDWLKGENADVFRIGDIFIDFITGRQV